MRVWAALVARELRAYFLQPLAWVVATAFLLLEGFFVLTAFSWLARYGGTYAEFVEQVFLGVPFWLLLLVVVATLSMRLFAEERRAGTLETLLTAPVSEAAAVGAKFAAAFLFYLILWVPTVANVVLLGVFSGPSAAGGTSVDLGPVAGGYLALALLGALFLAAGTLASVLTRSQVIAAVVAFLAGLLLLVGPYLLYAALPGETWQAILDHLSLLDMLAEFSRGVVDLRRLVYPATGTLLLLYASVRALEVVKARTA